MWVTETASWPLTCNVPSMAARRREACWRLITGRLSVPPPISQRQAGTTAILTWSRHCRSERMTQFWHPTGVQGPAGQVFRQRRLGRERRARGDSGSPAPRRVAGPGFWQVQRPAGERRPGPGNIGQVDRDLRVLHRQTQARALPDPRRVASQGPSAMFGRGRCVTGKDRRGAGNERGRGCLRADRRR